MSLTVGIDIGGTKVGGSVVDEDGAIVASARRDTPSGDGPGLTRAAIEVIQELRSNHQVEAIGVGSAGYISSDRSTVEMSPNLPWNKEPLRDNLRRVVDDLPIVVENDANVALWGEYRFGAARQGSSAVLFTVGTGIGGGIVLGGELVRGSHGFAGEMGHSRAVMDGRPCPCGSFGCLEQYASGNALTRSAREGAAATPHKAPTLLKLAGGDAEAITGYQVTEAALEGDEVALEAFGFIGRYLGMACADMVQLLDPDHVIIAGGVIAAGDLLMGPIQENYERELADRKALPSATILPAELGTDAGVIGAADLARR
ncbi:ROK family glucokinase [Natronoglycomyces albus]|uniref:Glucokinase n=1 Tax=Natronoglycomyces albus TaxID=2811108 RepID=A0A895XKP4_9ACTN|nr:ROK family glucokinase [Natronoglycomyces albus]QSB06301.1 ROK family glucokinase [Natronoglycomyces albus]